MRFINFLFLAIFFPVVVFGEDTNYKNSSRKLLEVEHPSEQEIMNARRYTNDIEMPSTMIGDYSKDVAKDFVKSMKNPTSALIKIDCPNTLLGPYWEVKEFNVWGGPGEYRNNGIINMGNGIVGLYQWKAILSCENDVKVCSGKIRINGPKYYLITINSSDCESHVSEFDMGRD